MCTILVRFAGREKLHRGGGVRSAECRLDADVDVRVFQVNGYGVREATTDDDAVRGTVAGGTPPLVLEVLSGCYGEVSRASAVSAAAAGGVKALSRGGGQLVSGGRGPRGP